ncbi:hypothetical protein CDD83_4362 [Cordyceps sp. RAO-2017]|nr:hypothetical protein CDD83_4362 [Cordyceps sp. RAO-2017]
MLRLNKRAVTVIEGMQKGQLKSFSWDMGVCLPGGVTAVLAARQPQILFMRLTTDGGCERRAETQELVHVKFPKLEDFAWIGPNDLQAQTWFLHNHRKQLRSLELDWTSKKAYGLYAHTDDGIKSHIWKMPYDDIIRERNDYQPAPFRLHSLRAISLSRIPISLDLMKNILKLVRLQSLTIRDCDRWSKVLAKCAAHFKNLRLKSLEIHSAIETWPEQDDPGPDADWGWLNFLDSIDALEELYIGIEVDFRATAPRIMRRIELHQYSLVKLVMHFRENSALDFREGPLDLTDLGLVEEEDVVHYSPFFDLHHIEQLGISCEPRHLTTILLPFTVRDTLKLVFGIWGVRSVEVVVFGDFAYGATAPEENLVMVRDGSHEDGYRVLDMETPTGRQMLSEHRRLLEACPIGKRLTPTRDRIDWRVQGEGTMVPDGFWDEESTYEGPSGEAEPGCQVEEATTDDRNESSEEEDVEYGQSSDFDSSDGDDGGDDDHDGTQAQAGGAAAAAAQVEVSDGTADERNGHGGESDVDDGNEADVDEDENEAEVYWPMVW